MGSLERRLERLEAERKRGEAELSREALGCLSDEDLCALEDGLEAALQEDDSATFEDLYRVVTEQERRALENWLECVEAIEEGREPPPIPEPGEEATNRRRNAYRIWKYRK